MAVIVFTTTCVSNLGFAVYAKADSFIGAWNAGSIAYNMFTYYFDLVNDSAMNGVSYRLADAMSPSEDMFDTDAVKEFMANGKGNLTYEVLFNNYAALNAMDEQSKGEYVKKFVEENPDIDIYSQTLDVNELYDLALQYENENNLTHNPSNTNFRVSDIRSIADARLQNVLSRSGSTYKISPWGCPELEKYYQFNSNGRLIIKGHAEKRNGEYLYVLDFDEQNGTTPFFYTTELDQYGRTLYRVYQGSWNGVEWTFGGYGYLPRHHEKYYANGILQNEYDNWGGYDWFNYFDLNIPHFTSIDAGAKWVNDLYKNSQSDAKPESEPIGYVATSEIATTDTLNKVLDGKNYVTYDELASILDKMVTGNYTTVNDYVTDARQTINNTTVNEDNHTEYHEGDSTVINNNYTSTYDDTALRSSVADVGVKVADSNAKMDEINKNLTDIKEEQEGWNIGGFFDAVKAYFALIVEHIVSWDFSDWFSHLFDFLDYFVEVGDMLVLRGKAIAEDLDEQVKVMTGWDFLTWFNWIRDPLTTILSHTDVIVKGIQDVIDDDTTDSIWDKLKTWLFPEWFKKLFGILEGWTFADWWDALLEKLGLYVKVVPDFLTDILTGIKTIADVIPLSITDVLTGIKALVIPDLDVIIPSIKPPNIPTWFPQFDFDGIENKYSGVTYPVISISTPTILRKFYSSDVIVLYDTHDHANIFAMVREVIQWVLYVGMGFWFLKKFQLHFST